METNRTRAILATFLLLAAGASGARGESCHTSREMEPAVMNALQQAAQQYFRYAATGDFAALRSNSIPVVAQNFAGIERAVAQHKPEFENAQATVKDLYLLEAEGTAPLARAQFLCGVWPELTGFMLHNLPPGRYGIVVQEVTAEKRPYYFSLILQEEAASRQWKLAGFYVRPRHIAGHDGDWYLAQARAYKARGQEHNAWFYYQIAHSLLAPLDFMSTARLEKLQEEAQQARPQDLPGQEPVSFAAGQHTFTITRMFPDVAGNELALVVWHRSSDVSDRGKAHTANTELIRALVNKYPEYRQAFTSIVARGIDPSGGEYGTLLAMKDVK